MYQFFRLSIGKEFRMSSVLLPLLVFVVAVLYSSAGFGGATGYLLVMSFFGIPPNVMASTALVLNVFVASISFANYMKAGHLRWNLLLPFLVTSIPAAFWGGTMKISEQVYTNLLYLVLTYLAMRMTFFPTAPDSPLGGVIERRINRATLWHDRFRWGDFSLAAHHPDGMGEFQTSCRLSGWIHCH